MQAYRSDLFGHVVHSETRKCTKCSIEQPIGNFRVGLSGPKKKTPRRWSECKNCMKARCRKYNKNNKPSILNNLLVRKYGITLSQFNAILEKQNHVCAICKRPERAIDPRTKKPRRLSVDHCHKTGEVRGLLCTPCNQAIGQLQDNPDVLHAAVEYLKNIEHSSGH